MSLRRNIFANYVSQIYVVLVGIAVVPLYLRLLGAEAYGLVAFFTLLQSWFQLLDMGLTATVSREAARHRGGAITVVELRQLLRSMEGFFWGVGAACGLALTLAAPSVARSWLNSVDLEFDVVATSVGIMGMTVALRWISGLYRGVIVGLERQVWLSVFNVLFTTIRFLGVVPVLLVFDSIATTFFIYQGVVAWAELLALIAFGYWSLPLPRGTRLSWSFSPLKSVFHFSATVAFTSSVWVLVTQTDKLIVSRLVTLQDYGFFAAAVLLASGITLISGPIAVALLPRLTKLHEERSDLEMVGLYRKGTQAVAALAGSAAVVLSAFSERVLWAWTGDPAMAETYAWVLTLYSIGNGFLALGAFPYYLQYAKGDLRLHFRGNVFFVVLLVPAIVFATSNYGVIGAGVVWAATNAAFFWLWTPLVHRRFLPGLHWQWVRQDIVRVLAAPIAIGVALFYTNALPLQRAGWIAYVLVAACCVVAVGLSQAALLRPQLGSIIARLSFTIR